MKPVIGITMGDPAGIGPELVLKTLSKSALRKKINFVVFGDYSYLFRLNAFLRRKGKGRAFPFLSVPVVDLGLLNRRPISFGRVSAWAGQASGCYIEKAVQEALAGRVDALVTLPIHKKSFALSGWGKKYTDHTQMLASLTKAKNVALMLVSKHMRAVHVTQHVPLKKVASLITKQRVRATVELAHGGLRSLGIARPRIAVCGLNPHAGDEGVLGNEERNIIGPVVDSFRSRGWNVQGPFSADVVWPMVKARKFDAGIAMYHDQGQIPVKMMGRGVVNVTLGLPIVRTSVGHGTGFDIAGRGEADSQSFEEAIHFAARMSGKLRRETK